MPAEIRVPSVGESISEAVIAKWILSEGDSVQRDQPVVELETDKANMEVPSPAGGRLSQIVRKPGDTVQVGDVIGYIEEGAQGNAPAAPAAQQAPKPQPAPAPEPPKQAARESAPVVTPAARRLLADRGVKPQEVSTSGRIGKEDVQRHLEAKKPEPPPAPPQQSAPQAPKRQQTDSHGRQEEVVPMSLLRKRVAKRLVEAQQTAALLTTFNECDMTAAMELRKRYQEEFQKEHGVKLGFMSFFVKAAVEALKAYPELNAYIQDDTIVYHDYYDIGVAVGAPKGLVVPIIRNAERLSFAEIEKTIGDFGERARNNRLHVDELQGGTFTISNGGVYGSMMSTPIVNPPQSGILGMHKIMERPVALNGQVVIRPMMYLALTYDHRIVDGREAVSFLVRIKECLENPVRLLLEI